MFGCGGMMFVWRQLSFRKFHERKGELKEVPAGTNIHRTSLTRPSSHHTTGRQKVCSGAALSASAALPCCRLPLLCCRGPWQALRYSLPTLVWLSTTTIHYKRARLQLGPVRTACVLFARCGAAAPPSPHCLRLCSRRLSRLQHPACPCYPPRRQVPHGCPKPSRHHRHALASAARVAPSVGSAWDASDVCAPWA